MRYTKHNEFKMCILVSNLTSLIYRKIAKPIIFKQHPDKAHTGMIVTGSFVQRIAVVRIVLDRLWSYKNPKALGQNIHGIEFKNPVGLSAGLDKNFELMPLMKAVGFGFMEGGSLTYKECHGNPKPWFYRLPKHKSLVVHVGLANQGVNHIIKRIKSYPENLFKGFPLNISVAKTNEKDCATDKGAIEDYVGSLEAIKSIGVGNLVTLNISCPNTYGGEPFTTPERLNELLKATDKVKLGQPLFVKMPINLPWIEFKALLTVIARHKVSGVTIGNLNKDRSVVGKDLSPEVNGNLSGKPTFALSNQLIRKTYQEFGNRFTIIGVGGIFSAEDAYTKIRLGASLVELITGLVYEGPQLVGQINRNLVKLLKADGYTNIHEVIGIDANKAHK